MKLIKPSEISAMILTLLDESDERVIIVSPYMKVAKWYKLVKKINTLRNRGIPIEIYVKDGPDNKASYLDLDQLALPYKKLPHLHSKLYMNEKSGIVTSMNLLLSSEFNSLEIGYATETWEEYNELLSFYHRYIHTGESLQFETIADQPTISLKEFTHRIRAELDRKGKNSWLWFGEDSLHICTSRNNYNISIKDSTLHITTRLKIPSGTRKKNTKYYTTVAKKIKDLTGMNTQLHAGPLPDIMFLCGQSKRKLKSACINRIMEPEGGCILESLLSFVVVTDDLSQQ